jgi:hypothetical protein
MEAVSKSVYDRGSKGAYGGGSMTVAVRWWRQELDIILRRSILCLGRMDRDRTRGLRC